MNLLNVIRVGCLALLTASGVLTACGGRGVEWVRADSKTTQSLTAIHGSGASDIWAVGELGTTIHWDGRSWSAVESGTSVDLSAVWTVGPRDAWAVGQQGVVLHWDGSRWSRVDVGSSNRLTGVWASGPDDVWVTLDTGVMIRGALHFDGKTWAVRVFPGSSMWAANQVWGSGPGDVWVSQTEGDKLMHWTGSAWSAVPLEIGSYPDVLDLTGTASGEMWMLCELVGDRRVVRKDGNGWTLLPAEETDFPLLGNGWIGVWGSGAQAWTVGELGTIFHFDGETWLEEREEDLYGGLTFRDVWGASETDVWAVGEEGVVMRRTPPSSS
ncbi:hypothetical protein JQX13_14795 [Archangium violaceum]|uniref:hypothetical protein n=1 Tax=Archangium violaceum TaxID=83451 RepID=UPI00193B96B4|nr:hypothetical protein [Archangium violaceum]QRK11225.1 hypothetical protein JQX13_14795 [Archangium violaceum]